MTEKTSAVTAERYAQGFSYGEYVGQINVNQDRFAQYYDTAQNALNAEDIAFFKEAVQKGCTKVMVVGEDWCPDVYRGMPVIARIAEASGMEMRVFPRDTNLDIADEFLNRGEFRSVPTLVFYTSDQKYVCHWIERPALATSETAAINEQLEREMAGKEEDAVRQARRERLNARFPDWQKETVRELRELLGQNLGK